MIQKYINEEHVFRRSPNTVNSYFQGIYPDDHWALHRPTNDDENFIAEFKILGIQIVFKLNPTDARGYRSIVCLVDDDMRSTFNRDYTAKEKLALNIGLCLAANIFEQYGLAVQTEIAGNNSQELSDDGVLLMGSAKEPSVCHGHIICRGNPTHKYIANIPLRGPVAGKLMNMRGDGADEGNTTKVKWKPEEMKALCDQLAIDTKAVLQAHNEYSSHVELTSLRATIQDHALITSPLSKI